MRSLRARLLLALVLVIIAFWFLWSSMVMMWVTREQSGYLDHSLRDVAHQVLTSLPGNIALLAAGAPPLELPSALRASRDTMSFQIWALPDTSVLRSMESPETPLQPDFREGYSVVEVDGRHWRVYAVTDASGRIQVQTAKSVEVLRRDFWRATKLALVIALAVFAVLGAILWKVIAWSLCPIGDLQKEVAARREYDFAPLSGRKLPHEVRPLVDTFNRLLARIERAVNNERQFIADAAHELRTPMAVVQTEAQVAMHATEPAERSRALQRLIAAVERGTRLAQQLLDSARLESGHERRHEPVDLAELVSLVAHEFSAAARQQGQTIVLNAGACTINGDIDELGILLRNLLDNAIRHSGAGSRIEVECCVDADARSATLKVCDDGRGVPDDAERGRLFDRFFRASGSTPRGSGIGLSLVRRIAESHGAELEATSGGNGEDKSKGLCIRLRFPRAAD